MTCNLKWFRGLGIFSLSRSAAVMFPPGRIDTDNLRGMRDHVFKVCTIIWGTLSYLRIHLVAGRVL